MTAVPDPWSDWRPWLPDAIAAAVVLLLALWDASNSLSTRVTAAQLLVSLGVAAAIGLSRRAPGAALAVTWFIAVVHLTTGTGALVTEALLAAVAFGCARWGSTLVVWLSGVSIPAVVTLAVLWLDPAVFYDSLRFAGIRVLAERTLAGTGSWRLPVALVGCGLLMAPWLLGLALRFSERWQDSRASQHVAEAERDQAAEIARLREEQARLARDVHDVVGHSLTVILAQAESAQYLDDGDTVGLKRTMATIATSARTSLDDVRRVLSQTQEAAPPPRPPDLDSLVDGVRSSGQPVESYVVGTPRPLPPDVEVVAFRVLQEMLTNAIRHGDQRHPVRVERHWEGELRIEVQNAVTGPSTEAAPVDETQPLSTGSGQGIEGMRRRLAAVGGRLDVRRRTEPPTFTVTAWIPVGRGS